MAALRTSPRQWISAQPARRFGGLQPAPAKVSNRREGVVVCAASPKDDPGSLSQEHQQEVQGRRKVLLAATTGLALPFVHGYEAAAGEARPTAPPPKTFRPTSKYITRLDPDNWDLVVKKGSPPVLVEYYAPWCPYCMKLDPIYAQLAKEYSDSSDVTIAVFDADEYTEFALERGFQGFFPNLILFVDGQPSRVFRGNWSVPQTLTKFVSSTTHPNQLPWESSMADGKPVEPQEGTMALQSDSVMELVPGAVWNEAVLRGTDRTSNGSYSLLLEFYAPWCPYCKKLEPVLEQLAAEVGEESGGRVRFARIDADAYTEFSEQYGFGGTFPELVLIQDGRVKVDYLGRNNYSSIKEFCQRYYSV
mmetsp:Transcript_4014/g.14290  ORF Transcript_4014/g.14290 Transcript_4014/m.14290 type:complete len:362 (-) Transcript_4014:851-1936(-)